MKRLAVTFLSGALIALAIVPSARAFGLKDLDVAFTNPDGSVATQAGSHPFAQTTTLGLETIPNPEESLISEIPDGDAKNLTVSLPPGLVGDPNAVPRCGGVEFALEECPAATQIGVTDVFATDPQTVYADIRVYSLVPPPGGAMEIGFHVVHIPVTVDLRINPNPPYNVQAVLHNITDGVPFYHSKLTIWGVPASPAHDKERGCGEAGCKLNLTEKPFLTMPRSCAGPLRTDFEAFSWQEPFASPATGFTETHDDSEPPNPIGMTGCDRLAFAPSIVAKPTTKAAESSSGLDFSLDVADEGLANPDGLAASDIRKAVVSLPEGMTVNPSSAEGLEVCTNEDLKRETLGAAPGVGCPEASKIGTIEVQTPLLDESLTGSLFLAEPYKNPAGSLIALYFVIENENLGIIVKQTAKVVPDPRTGQLVTTTDEIPQLPFSSFKLHFREGARSPLVSPPSCDADPSKPGNQPYDVTAELTPWAGGSPVTATSSFQVIAGPGESPCPSGGTPPFDPGFEGGTQNNQAGSYSPFYMRITRRDGDQDLTKFSAKLPPGMVARLAGTSQCSDAAIAQTKTKTGKEELASPSCPASSEIGHVLAGAGVGPVLTRVPGKIYMAGPYQGAPLSVVGVVPAVAGPFDIGTVVTRQALQIDPRTAEVRVDGDHSDPIPHILAGIPLKVRDIRVYVDKPKFTINPTSCEPFALDASLWGGGREVFSSADDSPLDRSSRFQAADCQALGFKPKLALKLKGGTKRGGHPALTGTYTPRGADANLAGLVLRLPRSAFLDQGHIRTICTRVQFAAKNCPAGAIYGKATAYTPLLEQPLSGPVYLRSSNHNLPDFVADLHGLIDVEAVARIDSKNGGIRATFTDVPDAPLSKVLVQMQGAKKGLIVNSRNLCGKANKANAEFTGQNGKAAKANPVMEASCAKKRARG
ncbi:MAG TPA: hypothetical protein VK471_10180 [Solirubrobacterales bacterium]|nr:hypothetical protein [Solirubrobacterales bacterium]